MTNSLEKIDSTLFQPLAVEQAAMVVGGAASGFTFKGLTELNGKIYNDYGVDPVQA